MLLTPDQLQTLTGYHRPSAQIRALKAMGIRHWVRPDGRPVVDDSALAAHADRSARPNFEAIV